MTTLRLQLLIDMTDLYKYEYALKIWELRLKRYYYFDYKIKLCVATPP